MGEPIINSDREIVKAFNEFAIELFMKTLESKRGNLVISPITVQSALTVALIGAGRGNETQDQLLNNLKYYRKFSLDRLISECTDAMTTVKRTKGIKLGSKMYIAENLVPFEQFYKYAKKSCKFAPQKISFAKPKSAAQKINRYALSKTQRRLGKLITKEELSPNSKMVLASAVHFRRIWDEEFDRRESFKSPFFVNDHYTIYMHYMCSRTNMKYAQVPLHDFRLLELPFKKSDLAMVFILPNKPNGIDNLQNIINQINIMEIVKHLKPITVTAEIPAFRIESNVNMIEPLRKMGITRAFTDRAQFDQMYFDYKGIHLSNVVHKACIEINEEGSKTSMSTASIMKYSGIQMADHFSCNQPFIFIVRCTQTNMIYFIGRVNFEREDNSYIPKEVYTRKRDPDKKEGNEDKDKEDKDVRSGSSKTDEEKKQEHLEETDNQNQNESTSKEDNLEAIVASKNEEQK